MEVLDGRVHAIPEQIVVGHFIVSGDVERSRRFCTEVLGGTVVFSGEPTYADHQPAGGLVAVAAVCLAVTRR